MKQETEKNRETQRQAKNKAESPKTTCGHPCWIVSVAIVVAIGSGVSYASGNPWLIGSIPLALAIGVLVMIYHGYFLARQRRWQRRQREESAAKDELNIPAEITKPRDFTPVDAIDQAQHERLPQAPDYQGRYRASGITVALLPSLALFCLALQVLLWPHGAPLGIGFVAAEAFLLAWLIILVWTSPNPPLRWVRTRLRLELLRREQYLCLAAVGPYLGLCPEEARRESHRRISLIVQGGFEQLKRLIPLTTPAGAEHEGDRFWIDDLWNHQRPSATFSDLLARMKSYLHYRIENQMMYFSLEVERNEHGEKWAAGGLKSAVILAALMAVAHAVMLAFESGHEDHSLPSVIVTVLAFVLPPVSAGILAMQNLFGFRTLAASYQDTKQELLVLGINLERLIEGYDKESSDDRLPHIEKQFQALVLRTEQALTHELEKWMMFVLRSEHEVAA